MQPSDTDPDTDPEIDPDTDPEIDPDTDIDSDTENDTDIENEEENEEELPPGLTLNDLHEELIATSTETRRGNRRMLEVLKNFGAVLDALSATVNDSHKALRAMPAISGRQAGGDELPRDWALALVELADRLGRVAEGFERPPAGASRGWGWWPGRRQALAAWQDAWAMQADALEILRSHVGLLLQRADLERMQVLGEPFDPGTMMAVESAVDPAKPDHTVLAEILPGWRHAHTHQLIRPAQVRVSRRPTR